MRSTITTIAALGTLGLLAACGGSSTPGVAQLRSTPTASASAGNSGPSALAYAQCMRSHGVPSFPDPNSQGQFNDAALPGASPQFQAATEACRALSPSSGQTTSGGLAPLSPQAQAQLLQFSRCMRSHGVTDFPDPTSHGLVLSGNLDPSSAQFQAANQACKSDLPGGGSGNNVSGGSSGASGQ